MPSTWHYYKVDLDISIYNFIPYVRERICAKTFRTNFHQISTDILNWLNLHLQVCKYLRISYAKLRMLAPVILVGITGTSVPLGAPKPLPPSLEQRLGNRPRSIHQQSSWTNGTLWICRLQTRYIHLWYWHDYLCYFHSCRIPLRCEAKPGKQTVTRI